MEKALTVGLNSDGKLEVNILNNETAIEKVDSGICVTYKTTVKYVKVNNESDIFTNIFNLALDIKGVEEENNTLTNDEEEFVYGGDCDYTIWVSESLIGTKLRTYASETLEFEITEEDIEK